jgi:hypothetical protein
MEPAQHQHQRHRVEDAIESTTAKVFARLLLPIMLSLIGFFMLRTLNGLQSSVDEQGKDIAQIKSDVRDVNTRLDERIIRTVDSNTRRIDALEDRVSAVEAKVGMR